ncbi:bifunctional enoyl-CoA hydratase/phosphate acetyltransferase [Pseudorhodobacter turbinis]|uniref:Bifunctional enoyl-CoA hydratase/phosphate acetyltransferase n=1 Tax=Pseudorhodobacter turbinis TaxID=2500533 RepID=A0A4P8EHU2_9RHOB|nr:bifunctional enoyl-CoA hydratase/phosphate acetyltransferase [Pseudorhodobacter turbinis]QCO56352.1 bifunctional enoyl-CoA hydratase/phosphate acetyltransferase [Pseudorhodobacter turbinis]
MILENRLFDALKIGDTASATRLCTTDDLYIFAAATGNHNPMNLPGLDGDGDGQAEALVPTAFAASLVAALLGTQLPGPGIVTLSQEYAFHTRAQAGDELVTTVTVVGLDSGVVTLTAQVLREIDKALILTGVVRVQAPVRHIRLDGSKLPGLTVRRHRHFEALLALAEPLPALRTAVICPENPASLGGAILAMKHTIITPILVGHAGKIAKAAMDLGVDLTGIEVIDMPTHQAAANCAVALVHELRADAVMKGHLHTDDMLRPMVARDKGLRIGRRLTHIFVMDVPGVDYPLLVTDAAINIAPDLATKVDIVQNAIDLAISIGIAHPRVGVLSATETVNPAIPSSIDAALLSKMAERGQITGGFVDGPLAMDNAVSMAAARTKGITSEVAGRAEVLVVPGIDAGNMLAKQLAYISHAEAAGLVMGARVPVILNSRSDSSMARLASCAVAAIHHARMKALAE